MNRSLLLEKNFEEEISKLLGDKKAVYTSFITWLVSISWHLPSRVIFLPNLSAPTLTRALTDSVCVSCRILNLRPCGLVKDYDLR